MDTTELKKSKASGLSTVSNMANREICFQKYDVSEAVKKIRTVFYFINNNEIVSFISTKVL